jgi:exopolyphosphatase / guanosine-5'-triphosphate,3'-diphosphate pyrophosphatase
VREGDDCTLEVLEEGAIGTRLGEGLRESGKLGAGAMERTLEAVAEFVTRANAREARLSSIATSAMRRAENAEDFGERMRALTGVPLAILEGEREAAESFRGAMYAAPRDGALRAVLDIGGGSTEVASGRDGRLESAVSLELGSVRITERFEDLAGAAPGAPARAAALQARRAIAAELHELKRFEAVVEVRAVAGTPLTLGAIAYASSVDNVSGRILARATLDAVLERLLDLSLAERRVVAGMLPQRADILPGGGLILSEALRLLAVGEARLESNDLLLGYLLSESSERT